MPELEELYEKETGNDARNIRFTAYSTWLEQKAEAGQKAIAELKTAKLDSARLIVQEEMYENSKCCGNCSHTDDGFECAFELPMTRWNNSCPKWQTDNLTRGQRMKK